MSPRLLDLFACEGGASVGYARAGFDVVAVDMDANRLRRNPHAAYVEDAFAVIDREWRRYDAIHASPPCQGYTRGNAGKVTDWPKVEVASEVVTAVVVVVFPVTIVLTVA